MRTLIHSSMLNEKYRIIANQSQASNDDGSRKRNYPIYRLVKDTTAEGGSLKQEKRRKRVAIKT